MPEKLTSLAAAAEYYGVTTKTLKRRIADGSLRAYRFGPRIVRVDLADLDQLLKPIPARHPGNVA